MSMTFWEMRRRNKAREKDRLEREAAAKTEKTVEAEPVKKKKAKEEKSGEE